MVPVAALVPLGIPNEPFSLYTIIMLVTVSEVLVMHAPYHSQCSK